MAVGRLAGGRAGRPAAAPCARGAGSLAPAAAAVGGGGDPDRAFGALGLSPHSLRALHEVFRYTEMTEEQAQLLPPLLHEAADNRDAIIRARAGTGKTLVYLLAALEGLARRPPPGVGALVLAPSRELALQIAREAEMLCKYHAVQVVPLIGGRALDRDAAMIRRRRPGIVVATPGRLVEHFDLTPRFGSLFEALGTLVLDECDHLLEEHVETLRAAFGYLPQQGSRRALLVSATIPQEVRDLASRVCRSEYMLLDCVGEGSPTQQAMQQFYSICPGFLLLTALKNAIADEVALSPTRHKVMVFFPTARLAAFAAHLFRDQLKMKIYELHARCEAAMRIVTQHEFSQCTSGVLFTSGVSHRGMDYPDISLVVQVLAPESREHYVHRVGRTARGGKAGRALLLLLDREADAGFLHNLSDLPVMRFPGEARLLYDRGSVSAALSSTGWAAGGLLPAAAAGAFASLLRHYQVTQRTVLLGADGAVMASSEILLGCGMEELPPVSRRLAAELGLEGHAGLRAAAADERGGRVPAAGADGEETRTRRPRQRRGGLSGS